MFYDLIKPAGRLFKPAEPALGRPTQLSLCLLGPLDLLRVNFITDENTKPASTRYHNLYCPTTAIYAQGTAGNKFQSICHERPEDGTVEQLVRAELSFPKVHKNELKLSRHRSEFVSHIPPYPCSIFPWSKPNFVLGNDQSDQIADLP